MKDEIALELKRTILRTYSDMVEPLSLSTIRRQFPFLNRTQMYDPEHDSTTSFLGVRSSATIRKYIINYMYSTFQYNVIDIALDIVTRCLLQIYYLPTATCKPTEIIIRTDLSTRYNPNSEYEHLKQYIFDFNQVVHHMITKYHSLCYTDVEDTTNTMNNVKTPNKFSPLLYPLPKNLYNPQQSIPQDAIIFKITYNPLHSPIIPYDHGIIQYIVHVQTRDTHAPEWSKFGVLIV